MRQVRALQQENQRLRDERMEMQATIDQLSAQLNMPAQGGNATLHNPSQSPGTALEANGYHGTEASPASASPSNTDGGVKADGAPTNQQRKGNPAEQ